MNKLTRYIIHSVLGATLLVLLVLSCLYLLFAFIGESTSIQGSYTYWDALMYVLLTLPANLYVIFPVVGLLGGLLGLGHLASHGELGAMRAAGISVAKIARSVVFAGILMGVVTFLIGAFVGPALQSYASVQKDIQQNGRAILMTSHSTWLKEGNHFVYIQSAGSNGLLEGITRFDVQNNQLVQIEHANSAYYDPHANWTLNRLTQTTLTPDAIRVTTLPQLLHVNLVSPNILQLLLFQNQSDNLTLPGLISYIHYRHHNELSIERYLLTFWQLIFQPIAAVILMLMAVPFVFGPMRSSGFGYRLVLGLLLGFVFFLVSQSTGPMVLVYHGSAFWGAAMPVLFFGGVLGFLIARVN